MAGRIIDYALHARLSPRANQVVYMGGAAGAAWLDKIGVNYQQSATLGAGAELLLIGPDVKIDTTALGTFMEDGGKVFFLPRSQADVELGVRLKPAAPDFAGSLSVPEWSEAKGLGVSDLRWRSAPGYASLGCQRRRGYWGRRPDWPQGGRQGCGHLLPIGFRSFPRGRKDLLPLHALAVDPRRGPTPGQLGVSFAADQRVFDRFNEGGFVGNGGLPMSLRPKSAGGGSVRYYYPDYRTDFPMGDNPYRYYRW